MTLEQAYQLLKKQFHESQREVTKLTKELESFRKGEASEDASGYFDKTTGAWFTIETQGKLVGDFIYQMISIDLDNSTLSISYKN